MLHIAWQLFAPETTDIYDKKNMPRLIFCIHALALYLFQKGVVRHQIQDLYGKVTFTQVSKLLIFNSFVMNLS
jgi:hypothetical protein